MTSPKITVLMPVYNGEKYLREAIESILDQTFGDFEFIIVNDGSTDSTQKIIQSYKDSRIKLVQNSKNLGIVASLNKGIKLAKGRYIARMDADDISFSERLKKQLNFLESNEDIAVCATWVRPLGDVMRRRKWRGSANTKIIKCKLLFSPVIAHPTTMIRKKVLDEAGGYSYEYLHAEDYDLWVRISSKYNITTLKEELLYYRLHMGQVGKRHNQEQADSVLRIRLKQLARFNMKIMEKDKLKHHYLCTESAVPDFKFLRDMIVWIYKLKQKNQQLKIFPEPSFSWVLNTYKNEIERKYDNFSFFDRFKFAIYKLIKRSLIV